MQKLLIQQLKLITKLFGKRLFLTQLNKQQSEPFRNKKGFFIVFTRLKKRCLVCFDTNENCVYFEMETL